MIWSTGRWGRFAIGLVAAGALAGCKGGQGEGCNSGGPLGPVYCDQGLVCNEADGYTCEQPGSRRQGQSCSSSELCASGLWCQLPQQTCVPFLLPGDPCSDPASCGPGLSCIKDPATRSIICGTAPDGGVPDGAAAGATVLGTLTLPESAPQGARGTIVLYAGPPPDGGAPVATDGFAWGGGASMEYQITGVPAGTYFVYGLVDVVSGSGLTPAPGDYYGWFGGDTTGNPPAAANAVVPASGTVRFDFGLILR